MDLNSIFLALLLVSIIQGFLEWLPVSSEAFIIIILLLFSVPARLALIIAIIMHLPTGLAAIIYYRREYIRSLRSIFSFHLDNITLFIIVGTVFTAFTAIPLYYLLKLFFQQAETFIRAASITIFILIGVAMLITSKFASFSKKYTKLRSLDTATINDAIFTGLIQGFAIIPGVSRSGVTIASLLWRGFNGDDSLRGSFILGGVISLLSFVFLCLTEDIELNVLSIYYLLIPMVITFVISLISIESLTRLAKKMDYPKFLRFMGSIIMMLSFAALIILLMLPF